MLRLRQRDRGSQAAGPRGSLDAGGGRKGVPGPRAQPRGLGVCGLGGRVGERQRHAACRGPVRVDDDLVGAGRAKGRRQRAAGGEDVAGGERASVRVQDRHLGQGNGDVTGGQVNVLPGRAGEGQGAVLARCGGGDGDRGTPDRDRPGGVGGDLVEGEGAAAGGGAVRVSGHGVGAGLRQRRCRSGPGTPQPPQKPFWPDKVLPSGFLTVR